MSEDQSPLTLGPSIDASSTLARAFLLINKYKVPSLPVTSGNRVVGTISARDIEHLVRRYEPQGEKKALLVGHYMQSPTASIEASQDLAPAIRQMLDRDVNGFILKGDHGETLGCLTRDNLLEILANLLQQNKMSVLKAFEELSRTLQSKDNLV